MWLDTVSGGRYGRSCLAENGSLLGRAWTSFGSFLDRQHRACWCLCRDPLYNAGQAVKTGYNGILSVAAIWMEGEGKKKTLGLHTILCRTKLFELVGIFLRKMQPLILHASKDAPKLTILCFREVRAVIVSPPGCTCGTTEIHLLIKKTFSKVDQSSGTG